LQCPPEEVLGQGKERIKEDSEKKTGMLEEFKGSELLTELNLLHKTGVDLVDPTDLSGSLKGSPTSMPT